MNLKFKKMKAIKKITTIVAIISLLLVSCNKSEKGLEFKKMEIKLADGQVVNYKVNKKGSLSFSNWASFNMVDKELVDIANLKLEANTERIEGLNGTISNLGNTIPAWLKNEEVMEDIDDVKQEYSKLLKEKNEPVKNVKQNLEELIEKFDDLREELNETIEKYKS